jgi:hypothetical protein
VIDLHSLAPATAKVALVTWFRYLRFLAAPNGGRNPWPERKTAVIVTGVACVWSGTCTWRAAVLAQTIQLPCHLPRQVFTDGRCMCHKAGRPNGQANVAAVGLAPSHGNMMLSCINKDASSRAQGAATAATFLG